MPTHTPAQTTPTPTEHTARPDHTFTVPAPASSAYLWQQGHVTARQASPEALAAADITTTPTADTLLTDALRAFDRATLPKGLLSEIRLNVVDKDPSEPLGFSLSLTERTLHSYPAVQMIGEQTIEVLERASRHIQTRPELDARLILAYRDPSLKTGRTTYTEIRHQQGLTTIGHADKASNTKPVVPRSLSSFAPDLPARDPNGGSVRQFLKLAGIIVARQSLSLADHRLEDQQSLRTLLDEMAGRVAERTEEFGLKHLTVQVLTGPGRDRISLTAEHRTTRRAPDLDPNAAPEPQIHPTAQSEVPDERLSWTLSDITNLPGVRLIDRQSPTEGAVIHAESAMLLALVIRSWVRPGVRSGGVLSMVAITRRKNNGQHAAAAHVTGIEIRHVSPGTVSFVSYGTHPHTGERRHYSLTLKGKRLSDFLNICHMAQRDYLQNLVAVT